MKPGTRFHSTNGDVCVVVVRPGADEALFCAGELMSTDPVPAAAAAGEATIQIGKRYHDEETGLEVLCVKGGVGPLVHQGRELDVKAAKQLPSSD